MGPVDGKLDGQLAAVGATGDDLHAPSQHGAVAVLAIALHPRVVGIAEALGDDQVGQRFSDRLFATIAEGLLRGRIEGDDLACTVHADDGVECGLDRGPQGLFDAFALGDLACDGDQAVDTAEGRAFEGHLVPVQAAVLVATVPFEALRRAGARQPDPSGGTGVIVGRDAGRELRGIQTEDLLMRIAVDAAGRRVGIADRPGGQVVNEDGVLRRLEDGPIARRGALSIQLGRGPDRIDLQHRLDQPGVGQGLAMQECDQTDRALGRVQEGIAGVSDGAEVARHVVAREMP